MIKAYTLKTFLSTIFLVCATVAASAFDPTDLPVDSIDCGEAIAGSNNLGENNFTAADYACYMGADNYDGVDSVFKVTLEEQTSVSFFLKTLDNADFDMFLLDNQVVDGVDCPGTCFAAGITEDDDLLVEDLSAGIYWIVVDIPGTEPEGGYVLSMECEGVFDTISCGDAVVDNTTGRMSMYDGTEYDNCVSNSGAFQSGDKTFLLELDQPEDIEISMSGDLINLGQVFLIERNMDGSLGACMANGMQMDGELVISMSPLAAGSYYVIVDGVGFPDFFNEGEFRLEIDCGKTYTDVVIDESYDGSTEGKISDFSEIDYADCIDGPADVFDYSAGDQLYRLELTEGYEVMVSLTSNEENLDLIIMDNYQVDGEDCPGNCIAFSNQVGSDSILAELDTAGVYWIIVDGEGFDENGEIMYNQGSFTLSISGTSLPIQLARFEAFPQNNEVKLEWTTASEVNSEKFIVQRSDDGLFWTDISIVDAQGFSEILTDYQHTDFQPMNGDNYYRLKMMDLDGSYEYSNVVNVAFGGHGQLKVYPNISSTMITVDFGEETPSEFHIIDAYGKVYRSIDTEDHRSDIDISQLASGMYYLHFEDRSEALPFIKQ